MKHRIDFNQKPILCEFDQQSTFGLRFEWFKPEDWPKLNIYFRRQEYAPVLPESLGELQERNLKFLLLKQDDEIIGTIGYDRKGGSVDLHFLTVDEPYRGNGYGSMLMMIIAFLMKNEGAEHIYGHPRGEKLYVSCHKNVGYVKV